MERTLTSTDLSGFCGDVIPLRLLGGEPYSNEKITWRSSNRKVVRIASFKKHKSGGFTDGVLLTLLSSGEAVVTATLEGTEYPCRIQVRPLRHAESHEPMHYYRGDLHDHTMDEHHYELFVARSPEHYPINGCLKKLEEDGRYDFAVLSDHSGLLNAREFYRGFADADALGSKNVYFPGFEGQVTQQPADRYGIERMHGGEVLCFHASDYFDVDSWDAMFETLKGSPFAFCGFAHPQIVGYSVRGIWDFRVRENNSRKFLDRFRLVEMGNGTTRESNLINEYFYSEALDNGFHVSPACSSDCHGPHWNFDDFPGKTILMAPEKTKEAFYDAIMSNRFYASSSGNVKLFYSVNGQAAPATLKQEGVYTFHVDLSYFDEAATDTRIQRCKVISDQGRCLRELENMGDHFEFTLSAPKAHYFYLCLTDKNGAKTWSCPVWTGRQFRKRKPAPLSPLSKKELRVRDQVSGQELPALINDDPLCRCPLGQPTADLLFDLGKEQEVSAVSNMPCFLRHSGLKQEGRKVPDALMELPARFRLSLSVDGTRYKQVAAGQFRLFGGEEFIRFKTQTARFLRLEILSTVGKESERAEMADAPLTLTEITLWK